MIGEAAIEELIGKKFIDWNIGPSHYYNKADLSNLGLNIGVKSVQYGKFPLIHKSITRPEIINLVLSDEEVLVCGYATIDSLNINQDNELVLSPFLRARGTKTGFYGFHNLVRFSNFDELLRVYNTDIFFQSIPC